MKALTALIGKFAAMPDPGPANQDRLLEWIASARPADLPHLHSFTRGLELDIKAATAAVTLPHHNGRTEGVNNKTKMIKRQMCGRAGFELLRHRIPPGWDYGTPPPEVRQRFKVDKPNADALRSLSPIRY